MARLEIAMGDRPDRRDIWIARYTSPGTKNDEAPAERLAAPTRGNRLVALLSRDRPIRSGAFVPCLSTRVSHVRFSCHGINLPARPPACLPACLSAKRKKRADEKEERKVRRGRSVGLINHLSRIRFSRERR